MFHFYNINDERQITITYISFREMSNEWWVQALHILNWSNLNLIFIHLSFFNSLHSMLSWKQFNNQLWRIYRIWTSCLRWFSSNQPSLYLYRGPVVWWRTACVIQRNRTFVPYKSKSSNQHCFWMSITSIYSLYVKRPNRPNH